MAAYIPSQFIVGFMDPNEAIRNDLITISSKQMKDALALFRDLPVVEFQHGERIFHEDDILFVDWICVGTTNWVVATSVMAVPVTFKNNRTGRYEAATIELTGKYAWTTTLVGVAATRLKACRYTVPKGMSMVLGHKRAHNSRLLLYPFSA